MLTDLRNVLGAACAGGVGAALLLPRRGESAEEKIPLNKLPPAIRAAANKAAPKVQWVQVTKQTDDGEVTYELAGVTDKKRLVTVEVDVDAEIVEVNRELDANDVPKPVLTAFRGKFPRAQIDAVFEVLQDDEIVGYEFNCTRPRKPAKGKGGRGKGKGKGKRGKPMDEEVTVIVSPDGKSVEIEGEDD